MACAFTTTATATRSPIWSARRGAPDELRPSPAAEAAVVGSAPVPLPEPESGADGDRRGENRKTSALAAAASIARAEQRSGRRPGARDRQITRDAQLRIESPQRNPSNQRGDGAPAGTTVGAGQAAAGPDLSGRAAERRYRIAPSRPARRPARHCNPGHQTERNAPPSGTAVPTQTQAQSLPSTVRENTESALKDRAQEREPPFGHPGTHTVAGSSQGRRPRTRAPRKP